MMTPLQICGIAAPRGELSMPARPRLVKGRLWYIEINTGGESRLLTQWRNQRFTEEIANFLSGVINQQILSGHFKWDEWFPHLKKQYLWEEIYWQCLDASPKRPATVANIRHKWQHFRHMANMDCREVTSLDFMWIRERHGDTPKAKAIRQVAQAFLNWAWKMEMLDRQIFLPPIRVKRGRTPYLPLDARWAIYEGMSEPYKAPMLLGLEMGLRIGEICALQWGDIDWEGQGINVCHTMSAYKLRDCRKGGDEVWLPMTEKVSQALMKLKSRAGAIGGYVFIHASGKQIWTQQLSVNFKSACRLVGLPHAKFHHLRHLCLHALSEAGATVKEAGALAGHRSQGTTERYIGSFSKNKLREIASRGKG